MQAEVEHRAQVALYSLLIAERYGQAPGEGLLYYMHTQQTQAVMMEAREMAGIMMRRNEHAASLKVAAAHQILPPLAQVIIIILPPLPGKGRLGRALLLSMQGTIGTCHA